MHEFLLCDVFGCESEASDLTSDKSSCALASERITEPTAGAESIFIGVQLMSLQLLTKGPSFWRPPDVRLLLSLSTHKRLCVSMWLPTRRLNQCSQDGIREGQESYYPLPPVEKPACLMAEHTY